MKRAVLILVSLLSMNFLFAQRNHWEANRGYAYRQDHWAHEGYRGGYYSYRPYYHGGYYVHYRRPVVTYDYYPSEYYWDGDDYAYWRGPRWHHHGWHRGWYIGRGNPHRYYSYRRGWHER